jgi:hypothetical protein
MTFGADGDIAVATSAFFRTDGECIWPHGYDYGVFKLTGASGVDFWGGCQDGRDNDGDGRIDGTDPGCSGPAGGSECTRPPSWGCGIGSELAVLLLALWRVRRLRLSRQRPGTSESS